ncbi:sigma-54-dependent transcriptional regulator [Massilia niastensis]|uniref:sigma-54-dependent transcriptional regulator n=1 Tax=Massilia niastensis TaxID=544911 RepID=UPI00036340D5|nr:sigma-54-dependent Fis family transcriptional regulator [Massilia niastensis]
MTGDARANRPAPARAVVGNSAVMRHLCGMAERVALTQRALLICGPSGAGKEVIAQLVHQHSAARDAPFVDVNCGAIPEALFGAELFGSERGAYTGSVASRRGHFEMASLGTLFLDEIGELPLALQPKLLRVLETRTYRAVGSNEIRRFEGRIIAATHCDLPAMIRAGKFREDLYYRLAVFVLEVPGLDQRREDIADLVSHFAACQPRRLTFTPAAIDFLCKRPWPGQVRELRNAIDRLAVLAESPIVNVEVLHKCLPHQAAPQAVAQPLAEALMRLDGDNKLAAAEKLLIDHALRLSDGNKAAAARLLGVSRKAVERRMSAREDRLQLAQRCLDEGTRLSECAEFRDAIPVLQHGLDKLADASLQDDQLRLRLELHRLLAVCHRSVNGWLSVDARSCYQRALEHAHELGDEAEVTTLLFGIWSTQLMSLELAAARATAQEMLQRAQGSARPELVRQAHLALANTLYWLGDSQEALACLTRAGLIGATLHDGAGSQGFDVVDLALTLEGLSAFQMGAFGRGRAAWHRLIVRSGPDNPHAFNRVLALQGAAWLACMFGDAERLGPLASDLEAVAREHGFIFYRGIGQVFLACTLKPGRTPLEAEAALADGYEKHMLCQGGYLFNCFQAWKRGELLLDAGAAAQCEALIAQALELAITQQDRAYLAQLIEVRARALLAMGDAAGAERELRSALSTAEVLGAVPARLSASTHLARLLADSGRAAEGKALLGRSLRGVEVDMRVTQFAQAAALLSELGAEGSIAVPMKGRVHGV